MKEIVAVAAVVGISTVVAIVFGEPLMVMAMLRLWMMTLPWRRLSPVRRSFFRWVLCCVLRCYRLNCGWKVER